MTTHFRVALFVDGRFEGVVGPRSRPATVNEARRIAKRWRKTSKGYADYRAVEFDSQGLIVWKDAPNG